MAKISLRAYNQEIGKLIEHGQTEEASAHCKYILKIFYQYFGNYLPKIGWFKATLIKFDIFSGS